MSLKLVKTTLVEAHGVLQLCELKAPKPCVRVVSGKVCGALTQFALIATSTPTLADKHYILVPLCEKHLPSWLKKEVK